MNFLDVEVDDGILRVVINRPEKRNALSRAVLAALCDVFTTHAEHKEISLAVVCGAGERCFAAGGDLEELDAVRDEQRLTEMEQAAFASLSAIRDFPVPVVAGLNGDALGGGAELAVACDMRVFAAHARIAFVQGQLAVSPAWGGSRDLMRLLGDANALRLLTRAEFIDAEEAWRLGLAQAIAAADETFADVLARFIAPMRGMRPHVMRAFKQLTRTHRDTTLSAGEVRAVERAELKKTWLHDDHWQAAAAVKAGIGA